MKLAEALVLRKHLTDKVKQLEPLKVNGDQGLFDPVNELSLRIIRKELGERSRDAELGGHVRAIAKDLLTR